jgi:hypothetical protein
MPILPIFGRGVHGRSLNVTAQRRINMYVEAGDDKSQLVLYSRPGMSPKLFNNNAESFGGGPVRGGIVVQRILDPGESEQQVVEYISTVIGNHSCVSFGNPDAFLTTATDTPEGVIRTSSGFVCFADNGVQIAAVDGSSLYYSPYTVGNGGASLSDIGATTANFPLGATSICSLATRFIVNDPNHKGRFYWSDPLDVLTWNALDFATAESIPDVLVAVSSWNGDLVLWGSNSIEFWAPSGESDVFRRTAGAGLSWGLEAQETIQDVAGRLFFVARSATGDISVMALRGYQAEPVSTLDIERDINERRYSTISALTVRKSGHTWYVLNLGTSDSEHTKTWAYDATSDCWDEWQTEGKRFAGQFNFVAYGRQNISDYRGSNFYGLDDSVFADGEAAMLREVQSRHIFHDLDQISISELRLDVEAGTTTEFNSEPPKIMMQVSRDGGHTFGNELWASLGKIGEYLTQVVWKRLGRARDFVFRFRISDPVKVVILGASVKVDK